jgi:hypothetical protein
VKHSTTPEPNKSHACICHRRIERLHERREPVLWHVRNEFVETSCPFLARRNREGKEGQGSALDPPRAQPLEPVCRCLQHLV